VTGARVVLRLVLGLLGIGLGSSAFAHAASTAYLDLGTPRSDAIPVQWVVPLRDLDAVLDLDADHDGRLTWAEVDARHTALATLARESLRFSGTAGDCTLVLGAPRYTPLESGGHAALDGQAVCPSGARGLRLDYRFLDGIDATHRVLLSTPATSTPRPVAPGERVVIPLGGSAQQSSSHGFRALLLHGITHIWGGADHLLFLVALLLPAVVARDGVHWIARARLRPALCEVLWIATAFTLAHSITLGLASFHVVSIPPRVIEPAIAFTVLAAALNNLKPVVTRRLAAVAFCFGLVHGFGFAEVLAPLHLPARQLAIALFGFNLGVELGQLALIACAFTLLASARHWRGYARWILGSGSTALAVTASIWIVERVFNVSVFALAAATR
jgi:HupE / UreJ protein